MAVCMKMYERHTEQGQYTKTVLVGVDEAGRGPVAGPLAVCAFAVCNMIALEELAAIGLARDSKTLTARQREIMFSHIESARAAGNVRFCVVFVSAGMIDRIGIAAAARRGVSRALGSLSLEPAACDVRLDGTLAAPRGYTRQTTIIRGDSLEPVISLASICAKVLRDRTVVRASRRYPGYDFDRHKGYGTRAHYDAIARLGITAYHRRSFLRNI